VSTQILRAYGDRIKYLEAQNAELLAALEWPVAWLDAWEGQTMPEWREWAEKARAAIAKAQEARG
jgi:hypothetical protein